jgi:hypothetical protein
VTEETAGTVVTFIVRITRRRDGALRGTVERVRTGEKERFAGAAGVGRAIEHMLEQEER